MHYDLVFPVSLTSAISAGCISLHELRAGLAEHLKAFLPETSLAFWTYLSLSSVVFPPTQFIFLIALVVVWMYLIYYTYTLGEEVLCHIP